MQTQAFEDKVNLFKNNVYLADSFRNGVMNSAETLLCRLHPSHIAMYSCSGGKLLPSVKHMAPEDVNRIFKNRTIDTAVLAGCSPYDCVDVTGKAYSEKDYCTKSGTIDSKNGANKTGSLYLTNDLSGSHGGQQNHVTKGPKNNYNIQMTLDRRKASDSYTENNTPFCVNNSSLHNERYIINNGEDLEKSDLHNNQTYPVTSYCKADPMYFGDPNVTNDLNLSFPRSGASGYVDSNQYNIQSGIAPACDYITTSASERLTKAPERAGNQVEVVSGTRPVSEVVSVPPHFYGSLSLLDDEGEVTEL